ATASKRPLRSRADQSKSRRQSSPPRPSPDAYDDRDVHEEPPLLFQLLEASREREVLVRRIHEHTSRSRPFAALRTLNSVPYVARAPRSTRALARELVWP